MSSAPDLRYQFITELGQLRRAAYGDIHHSLLSARVNCDCATGCAAARRKGECPHFRRSGDTPLTAVSQCHRVREGRTRCSCRQRSCAVAGPAPAVSVPCAGCRRAAHSSPRSCLARHRRRRCCRQRSVETGTLLISSSLRTLESSARHEPVSM